MKLEDFLPKGLISSDDDAISLLTADHDKVKDLFKQFEEIKDSRGGKQKEKIVAQACHELTIHTKLEDEIFYPAVRSAIDDDNLMNEAKVEHDGAKGLIAQLESMDAGDELYVAKFTVLSEYVKHHIEEEQNEMFPKARKAEQLDMAALGQRMLKRKQELNARPARGKKTRSVKAVAAVARSTPRGKKANGARARA